MDSINDFVEDELDFEKDLQEERAASMQNYQTARVQGYANTVIGYAASEHHSMKGGDMPGSEHDEEFNGKLKI
jgi:hypothetical protein